jgi:hypothetical protein
MSAKLQVLLLISMAVLAGFALPYAGAPLPQPQEGPDVLQSQRGHNPDQSPTGMDRRSPGGDNPIVLTEKQRKELLHANLVKSRRDAAELSALARQLRDDLNQPTGKSLSRGDLDRLDKIEKLAKKIRDELKAY